MTATGVFTSQYWRCGVEIVVADDVERWSDWHAYYLSIRGAWCVGRYSLPDGAILQRIVVTERRHVPRYSHHLDGQRHAESLAASLNRIYHADHPDHPTGDGTT